MIQACQNSGVGALGSSSADMPAVHTASNSTDDKHVVLIRDHTVLLLASKPGWYKVSVVISFCLFARLCREVFLSDLFMTDTLITTHQQNGYLLFLYRPLQMGNIV